MNTVMHLPTLNNYYSTEVSITCKNQSKKHAQNVFISSKKLSLYHWKKTVNFNLSKELYQPRQRMKEREIFILFTSQKPSF